MTNCVCISEIGVILCYSLGKYTQKVEFTAITFYAITDSTVNDKQEHHVVQNIRNAQSYGWNYWNYYQQEK